MDSNVFREAAGIPKTISREQVAAAATALGLDPSKVLKLEVGSAFVLVTATAASNVRVEARIPIGEAARTFGPARLDIEIGNM